MAVAKQNGDVIPFVKQKDYIMVNNDLGGGSFGKTVLLQDPFIDELFVAKKYEPEYDGIKEQFYKNFLDEIKILYKLNHRNIVRIYNYYAYENIYTGYILMEYIDGENIGDFIHRSCLWNNLNFLVVPNKANKDFRSQYLTSKALALCLFRRFGPRRRLLLSTASKQFDASKAGA